ncbi:MAG: acetyl-CoA carboxylase carboxyltransferase subunit alpha [Clostridia bacterium]|nr:acetyl-CoA carboxylase carboxyltransferase subunit alpha [Clostridia bacterium]
MASKKISAWDRVLLERFGGRPTALDYIDNIFDEFVELHGDRQFADDKAIVCGLARIDNINFTVVAEQKGRNTKENIERNFGMPNPESYRKALRFMKQAEKFGRPIITFVDTKGAYPGVGAEERGQGESIARNLMEMSSLKTPIIVAVIGEGSSGGALAIGVGDKILMLENAIYSILSPEGYATILWKDGSRAKEAAEVMKLTAEDLYDLKVIDKVIPEPEGGAEKDIELLSDNLRKEILKEVKKLNKKSIDVLLEDRYNKFRKMGEYENDSKR